jgi:hypothetical protein
MKPSLRTAWRNFWRSELSFVERCAAAARNNAIKVRTGHNCCGHPGEPGC